MRFVPNALRPGWIDEARLLAQEPAFRSVLQESPRFQGRCLNAGCGDGLYAGFLESFPKIREIVHMDLTYPVFVEQRADSRNCGVEG